MKNLLSVFLLLFVFTGCYSVTVNNRDSSYEFFLLLKSASEQEINTFLDNQSDSYKESILNNTNNPYGYSSIAVVILERRPELVSKLMEYGADVNAKGKNGSTALHIAASLGELTTVEMLVNNYKADLLLDDRGQSALHYAALRGNNPTLAFLSTQFPNMVNDQDSLGNTALFYAVTIRDLDNISILIKNKANAQIKNNNKETPLSYAQNMHFTNLISILSKKPKK